MQTTIITVGTLKEEYLRAALAEYRKRLHTYTDLTEVSLREEPVRNEDDPTAVRRALQTEGEHILAAIPQGSRVIALCVEGTALDSQKLAEKIGEIRDATGKLTLIIGSSHGLSPAVKARADLRLSLSALTFPHQLMRVILAEALYRSFTILAGKKYHK